MMAWEFQWHIQCSLQRRICRKRCRTGSYGSAPSWSAVPTVLKTILNKEKNATALGHVPFSGTAYMQCLWPQFRVAEVTASPRSEMSGSSSRVTQLMFLCHFKVLYSALPFFYTATSNCLVLLEKQEYLTLTKFMKVCSIVHASAFPELEVVRIPSVIIRLNIDWLFRFHETCIMMRNKETITISIDIFPWSIAFVSELFR